jgi:hypothetical protein
LSQLEVKSIDDLPQFLESVSSVLTDLEQKGLLTPEEQINALGIMVGTYLQDMADIGKWKQSFIEFVEQQNQPMREAANAAYRDFCAKHPELNLPENLDYGRVEQLDQMIASTIDADSNLSSKKKVHTDRAQYAARVTRTGCIYGIFIYATGKLGAWESSGPTYTPNNLDNIISGAPVMVTADGLVVQPIATDGIVVQPVATEIGYIAAVASYLKNFFGPDKKENKTPTKTVEDIVAESKPGKKTKGKVKQYEKPGGFEDALKDFEKLNPSEIKEISTGKIGKLSDGRVINVRNASTDGRPTLEIYNGSRSIKIRYGNK